MMKDLTPVQQTVLGQLGKNLFGQDYTQPEKVDTAELITVCGRQAVTGVVLSGLSLPNEAQRTNSLFTVVANNNAVNYDHTAVHKLMQENGIPYVILKGAASASYYPDPILRTMGDVDFLVKPEDLERTSELLTAAGFVCSGESHRFHRAFKKGKTHLELHFAFAEKINPEIDRRIDTYLSSIVDEAQLLSNSCCTCRIPDPFHHGLVLLLHMQRHMLSSGLGLRHLSDWAVFVRSFRNDAFCALFQAKLEAVGLWKYAQTVSLASCIGLGLPYEAFMGEDRATAEELLQDILMSGNFGRNDRGRTHGSLFIERSAYAGKSRSRFGTFVHKVNKIIYSHWPKAKDHILLRLLGWIYFPIRRIVLRMMGKRTPADLAKGYRQSISRQKLYDKFRLFEIEE